MRLSDVEAYEKYAGELVRFATGLAGPSDAADVVADTFVRVIESRTWPEVDEPRAYLYQAVLNQVRMRHRSTMRRRARDVARRLDVSEGTVRQHLARARTKLREVITDD